MPSLCCIWKQKLQALKTLTGRGWMPAPPLLKSQRVELCAAWTPPPPPDVSIYGQTDGVGEHEHTISPRTSVLTQFPACMWARVPVCVPPPSTCTLAQRSCSSSVCGSPDPPSLLTVQKNTGLLLYKEPQGSLDWPLPQDVCYQTGITKAVFLCLFLETYL